MTSKKKISSAALILPLLACVAVAGYIKYGQDTPTVVQNSPSDTGEVEQQVDNASANSQNPAAESTQTAASNDLAVPVETKLETKDEPVASTDATDAVLEKLRVQLPQFSFTSAKQSSIAGLYEVVSDGQILYVNESADHILDGSLIRLQDRVNLTDVAVGRIHVGMIEGLDEKDMLIFEPDQPSNRSITVFTDISCGYCRKLHEEMDQLLDAGVRVRYLLFPRAGLGSQAHKDLESVWCAENQQVAMTNAKSGGAIEALSCDNPIEAHVELAQRLGLRGTPLIYTDSGEKLTGYRQADILAQHVLGSEPMSTNN